MERCWPLKMPPTAKAVLMSLAGNADDDGYCWPSLETIMERTCFGRNAVIDAIRWLEGAGALSADRTNGRKTTYTVTPERFNSDFERPSRRAAGRANQPVAHANPSARKTGGAEQPVGQSTGTSGAKQLDQLGKATKPVGQSNTNRKEPSLNSQRTVKVRDEGFLMQTFEDFWKVYPKKRARPKAFAAWRKLNPSEFLVSEIMAAVAVQRKSAQWTKDRGEYIPYPASYLNGERWTDDSVRPAEALPKPGTDAYFALHRDAQWWRDAGFENVWEAHNGMCWDWNAHEFRDGQRTKPAEAHA